MFKPLLLAHIRRQKSTETVMADHVSMSVYLVHFRSSMENPQNVNFCTEIYFICLFICYLFKQRFKQKIVLALHTILSDLLAQEDESEVIGV